MGRWGRGCGGLAVGLPAAALRALPACRRGFSGRDGEEAGGRRAARGRCPPGEVAVDWLTGLPAAAPRALPACRRGFCWRGMGRSGGPPCRSRAVPSRCGAFAPYQKRNRFRLVSGPAVRFPFTLHSFSDARLIAKTKRQAPHVLVLPFPFKYSDVKLQT